MTTEQNVTNTFVNLAVMLSVSRVANEALRAFDNGNHAALEIARITYDNLLLDIEKHVTPMKG